MALVLPAGTRLVHATSLRRLVPILRGRTLPNAFAADPTLPASMTTRLRSDATGASFTDLHGVQVCAPGLPSSAYALGAELVTAGRDPPRAGASAIVGRWTKCRARRSRMPEQARRTGR